MNPKQRLTYVIFKPVIDFFQIYLRISPCFAAVIFFMLIAIPILRNKSKSEFDGLRKIAIIIGLIVGIVLGVLDTLELRGIITRG